MSISGEAFATRNGYVRVHVAQSASHAAAHVHLYALVMVLPCRPVLVFSGTLAESYRWTTAVVQAASQRLLASMART